MKYPADLKYTKDHEWISLPKNGQASIGVTAYAIEQLGDIVHVELPEVGASYKAGDSFGTIESTKTVSDLYCPVSGEVVEVNQKISSDLDRIKDSPFRDGWLVRVSIKTALDKFDLMDASSYEKYIAGL